VAGGLIAVATFSRTQHFSVMFGVGRRCSRARGVVSGTDEILADPAGPGHPPPQMQRFIKLVGSFRLDSVLRAKGGILDPGYGIWE
jgi:hypothetical protein